MVYDEYFCPRCNAILNQQLGFDPDLDTWTCTACGQSLYGDEIESTMDQFDGVVWYCDSCNAILNKQPGFYDSCEIWYCTECGHANLINESEIYESEEDYQNSKTDYEISPSENNEDDEDDNDTEEQVSDYSRRGHSPFRNSRTYREKVLGWVSELDSGTQHTACKAQGKEKHQIPTLLVILVIIIGIGYYEYTKLIPVQADYDSLIGQPYTLVVEAFENAGFSRISTQEISDLKIEESSSEYQVTNIEIGFINSFHSGRKIPSNFPVKITYHTVKKIAAPISSKAAKQMNYRDVVKAFEDAGFINIELSAEYDITIGWIRDDGEIKEVAVGDSKKFSEEDLFRPDCKVTVTYHTFKKNKPN